MQRYDSYKDSGIQWLGELPSHWEVCKIKNVSQISSGSTPKSSIERYWGGGIKWITPADFKTDTKYVCKGMRDITEAGALSCSTKLIPKNSVVFSKRAPVGQVSITTDDLCINQGCIACIPNESIITPFFFYLLSCYKDEFESLSGGTTFKEIALNVFADFKISIPPLPEQQAIASYLDTATAKIDEAIAQQQKMIDLLNERKQIIINNAVTKGLNPNAKMKPSGIDWIGNIPEHWEVMQYRHLFYNLDNLRQPISADQRSRNNPQYDYYGASGVIDKIDYYNVDDRVLLIGEDGANLLLRNLPLIYKAKGKFWVNNHAHILKPIRDDYDYMAYVMEAADYTLFITGSAQPKLSQSNLNAVKLPIPPIEEQQSIVKYLEQRTEKIDTAISNSSKQIALLQERKQIIINDVVTGKVKV